MINGNLEHILVNSFSDKEGRLIGINCEIDSKAYCVINFYLHNNEKRAVKFGDRMNASIINENISNLNDTNIIMGGDFNCPLDIKKDKNGGRKHAKTKLIQSIEGMQRTFNLQDIWRSRVKHPNEISFTWRASKIP